MHERRHGITVPVFLSFLLSLVVDDRRRTPDPLVGSLVLSPLLGSVCRRIRQLGLAYMLAAVTANNTHANSSGNANSSNTSGMEANTYMNYTLPLTLLSPALAMQLQSWTNASTTADIPVRSFHSQSSTLLSALYDSWYDFDIQ